MAVAAVIAGFLGLSRWRGGVSREKLSAMAPEVTQVTIHDLDVATWPDPAALGETASAPFPAEAFRRAASNATVETVLPTIWKGSIAAVITLRDGTRLRGRFSYYGGFFHIEGLSGRFVVPGEGASEFQAALNRVMQEQLIPRRRPAEVRGSP